MISVYLCDVHFYFAIYYIIKINNVNKNRVTKIVKKTTKNYNFVVFKNYIILSPKPTIKLKMLPAQNAKAKPTIIPVIDFFISAF